ncbi:hypothetical protein [Sulfurimonas sp.]
MQNIKQAAIPLHDIKPLLEIHEYSLYYFIAIIVIITLIAIGLSYLGFRWYKNRHKFNIRAEHYRLLKKVDFSQPKKAAYDVTFYATTFKDDSQQHVRAYENMLEKLEKYKYKKEVDAFDADTIHYIELFEGLIDV